MTDWVVAESPSSGGPNSVAISAWIALAVATIFRTDITHRLCARTDALPCFRRSYRSERRSIPAICESEYRYEPRVLRLTELAAFVVHVQPLVYAVDLPASWSELVLRCRRSPLPRRAL